MKKIQEALVTGKKVFVRVDYNVPIKNGQVSDNERIIASLETINFLVERGAALILCSHLGRPDGRPNTLFTLEPVAKELGKLINKSVQFSNNCIGKDRDKLVQNLKSGEILLLENVRFFSQEEANDPSFAKGLASGCDLYVNDAFSVSHRNHTSIVGVPKILESYAGFCLQKEVENLSKLLLEPKRPFVLILGGAKITDKIELLENLIDKIDTLILGGAIANTFLLAKGYNLGKSIVESGAVDSADKILKKATEKKIEVLLPEDVVVADSINDTEGLPKPFSKLNIDEMILDIGESTIIQYANTLEIAETIFWNGPMGLAETAAFAGGTRSVGQAISNTKAFSVVGGGDTIASLDTETKKNFSYISMAGGAALEFLSGKSLPGLKVLESQ